MSKKECSGQPGITETMLGHSNLQMSIKDKYLCKQT